MTIIHLSDSNPRQSLHNRLRPITIILSRQNKGVYKIQNVSLH